MVYYAKRAENTMAKVSSWNLIKANRSYLGSFQNLFPNYSESFRTNTKKFWISFNANWFEINPISDSFGLIIQFRSIRVRIESNWFLSSLHREQVSNWIILCMCYKKGFFPIQVKRFIFINERLFKWRFSSDKGKMGVWVFFENVLSPCMTYPIPTLPTFFRLAFPH